MIITAYVRGRTIHLPPELQVAEGTTVQVVVQDVIVSPEERQRKLEAWLDRVQGSATTGLTTDEIMQMTRGED